MGSTDLGQDQVHRITIIEGTKDELVERVEAFFEYREQQRMKIVPIEKSQFQNVCRMAMSTSSVREVVNFIRYQIGRARQNEKWQNNGFGEALVKELEAVANLDQSVSIELVRLFLGFWSRHAVYKRLNDN